MMKRGNDKNNTQILSQNKHVVHNIVFFSQKILNILKTRVLPRYPAQKVEILLEWLNKTLTYLGENELLSNTNSPHSIFILSTLLEFIISIYSGVKGDEHVRLQFSPI
jgi:hypothetical protein